MKPINVVLFILFIANAMIALNMHSNYHAFLGWFVAGLIVLTRDNKKAN